MQFIKTIICLAFLELLLFAHVHTLAIEWKCSALEPYFCFYLSNVGVIALCSFLHFELSPGYKSESSRNINTKFSR